MFRNCPVILNENGYLHRKDSNYLAGSSKNMMDCMNYLASIENLGVEDFYKIGFENPLNLIRKNIKSSMGKLLRHPFSGAGLAMKHDLPDKVVHTIAVHAKEGDGGFRCPEAVIVHHADFMNFESLRG